MSTMKDRANSPTVTVIDLTTSDDDDDGNDENNRKDQDSNLTNRVQTGAVATKSTGNPIDEANSSNTKSSTTVRGLNRIDIGDGWRDASLPLKKRKIQLGGPVNNHEDNSGFRAKYFVKNSNEVEPSTFSRSDTALRDDDGSSRTEQIPRHDLLSGTTTKGSQSEAQNTPQVQMSLQKTPFSLMHQNECYDRGTQHQLPSLLSILEQHRDKVNYSVVSLDSWNASIQRSQTQPRKKAEQRRGTKIWRVRVLVPQAHDVLQGHGMVSFQHPGSVFHRKLVASRKIEYLKTPRGLGRKRKIAEEIVATVQTKLRPPGRFLAYEEHPHIDHEEIKLVDANDCYSTVGASSHIFSPSTQSSYSSLAKLQHHTAGLTPYWYILDDSIAIRKTMQALRDCPIGTCGIK